MTVPLEIVHVVQPENQERIRTHLNEMYLEGGLLRPDVSNYARGRQRAWLQVEAPLGNTRPWQPGVRDERLWNWILENIWAEAELGLVAYGQVGIRPHRDASYADYEARSINLGEIEGWWYEPGYSDFGPGPQTIRHALTYKLAPGDVIRFNCKNQHAVINPAPDRWSINLWRVSDRARARFEAFMQ